MWRLTERRRSQLYFRQPDAWSLGDQPSDPPRRRALILGQIAALEQAQLERVSEAQPLQITRSRLRDLVVPGRHGPAEACVWVALRRQERMFARPPHQTVARP